MENTLTVKEAKEQGYSGYFYNADGFQRLKSLDYPDEIDWSRDDIYLADKESYNPGGIDAKALAELLAEHLQCNHESETGDDEDAVYDAIMEIDFTDVELRIDEALSKLHYYRGTKIRLTNAD